MASLDDMALFAAVVRFGGFTAAARQLDQPLSSVSRRISQLESDLGVRLLVRTTRSLKMTEAGKVFFQHCQKMVEQAEDAQQALQRLQVEPSGHLRMALPFSVDDVWATTIVSGFLSKYPKINLETVLCVDGPPLDDESMDVIFAYGERPETHNLVVLLGKANMALFASPKYLQRAGTSQNLKDLEGRDMVRFAALPFDQYAPDDLRAMAFNYRISTNEVLMARLCCLDGLGIAWLPTITCVRHVSKGRLVRVLPEVYSEISLWLVCRNSSHSSLKVTLLVDYLRSMLGKQAVWDGLELGVWS